MNPVNVPDPMRDTAEVWAWFAAHALGGLDAFGHRGSIAPGAAAKQADAMLEEYRARFHHQPPEKT